MITVHGTLVVENQRIVAIKGFAFDHIESTKAAAEEVSAFYHLPLIDKDLATLSPARFFCPVCGKEQPVNWRVEDEIDALVAPRRGPDLWRELDGLQKFDGRVCPACFDRLAAERRIHLRWVPVWNGFDILMGPECPARKDGKHQWGKPKTRSEEVSYCRHCTAVKNV